MNISGVIIFILLIMLVLLIASQWKMYERFYDEKGWKSIIPIYNNYIWAKYSFGQSKGWYGVVISIVGIVLSVLNNSYFGSENGVNTPIWFSIILLLYAIWSIYFTCVILSRLDAGAGIIVLCVLLPVIGYPVVAFREKGKYLGSKDGTIPADGVIEEDVVIIE